jgi:hypothetical protein
MSAGVTRDGRPRGRVEVCFAPLAYSGWWQYAGGPLAPLLAFVAAAGFVVVAVYLRAVFRRLEVAQAKLVPGGARDTLNALVEGVLILNHKQRIIYANDEFVRASGMTRDRCSAGSSPTCRGSRRTSARTTCRGSRRSASRHCRPGRSSGCGPAAGSGGCRSTPARSSTRPGRAAGRWSPSTT